MPGPCLPDRRRGADILSRVASLLWLVTALSVLQWSAPGVDPSLFQRLLAGEAGLAQDDRAAPTVIEARAAPAVVVAEKRACGGRPLSSGTDDIEVAGVPAIRGIAAIPECVTDTSDAAPPRAVAACPFAARGPPTAA